MFALSDKFADYLTRQVDALGRSLVNTHDRGDYLTRQVDAIGRSLVKTLDRKRTAGPTKRVITIED